MKNLYSLLRSGIAVFYSQMLLVLRLLRAKVTFSKETDFPGQTYYCAGKLALCFLFFLVFSVQSSFGQTPGMIIQKATGNGVAVLDPDNNGYVSKTKSGFSGSNDTGANSEIPFKMLPQFTSPEPLNDLATGSNGGHTDLANAPLGMWFDGTNVYFRVRLGGHSTASKGYSFVIDGDGVFNAIKAQNGTLISYRTPSDVKNYGFEYEVVFASNFDVLVYRHQGSGDANDPVSYSSNIIWEASKNGGYTSYSQKSIAGTTEGGNADYFYDFYVPLSAFGGGITEDQKLRISGSTVTSAQTGLEGTISDIGGVNDKSYGNDKTKIWKDVIPAFPPTSLNEIKNGGFGCVKPSTPAIIGTLKAYDTTIKGIANVSDGSTIKLYKNGTVGADGSLTGGTLLATSATVVVSGGSWTATLAGGVFINENDFIRAVVTSTEGCVSAYSTAIKVIGGICSTPAPLTPNASNGGSNKDINGTYTGVSNSTITFTIYKIMADGRYSNLASDIYQAGTGPVTQDVSSATGTYSYGFGGTGQTLNQGSYVITAKLGTGCESAYSPPACLGNKTASAATPTWTMTTSSSTVSTSSLKTTDVSASIQVSTTIANNADFSQVTFSLVKRFGTAPAYSYVTLATSPLVSGGTATYTFSLTQSQISNLSGGDVLLVRALGNATAVCPAESGSVITVTASALPVTSTPAITGTYCTSTSILAVNGTSSEMQGTTINVYKTGTATPIGTASVLAGGVWSASIPAGVLTPTATFYATATAVGKSVSTNTTSATVTGRSASTGLVLTSPIPNGAIALSGTSTKSGTIFVYVDGEKLGQTATVTSSGASVNWTVSGITQGVLVAGLPVQISISETTGCGETEKTQAVAVSCAPPVKTFTVSPLSRTICTGGTVTLTTSSSQEGVVYQIFNQTTGAYTGSSVLGTGAAIELTSSSLSNSVNSVHNLFVKAYQVVGGCEVTLSENTPIVITLSPTPVAAGISASSTNVCFGQTVAISATSNLVRGLSYRLYRNGTAEGEVIVYNGSNKVEFTPVVNAASTKFTVVASSEGCMSANSNELTITTTSVAAPIVSSGATAFCGSGSTTISVSSPQIGYRYELMKGTSENGVSETVTTWPAYMGSGSVEFYVNVKETTYYKVKAIAGVCESPVSSAIKLEVVNCNITYKVEPAYQRREYIMYEIMATPITNPDSSYTFTGDNLLIGTAVDSKTGQIYVSNLGSLATGTKTANIFATNTRTGKVSRVPVTYSVSPDGNPTAAVRPLDPIVLPVELISFAASQQTTGVQLRWATASEKDNDFFQVERSLDAKNFVSIGQVKGNGTSNVLQNYSFTDATAPAGTVYYRLKQVDFDGKFEYSKVIAVKADGKTSVQASLEVKPNPTPGKLFLTASNLEGAGSVTLLHTSGKAVSTQEVQVVAGQPLELDLSKLSPGVYILQLKTSTGTAVTRIVKQ
ncbi:T9SS type A sorting domain-containing protein [Sabulibacter ruber]|uniref:T9SS type A sorting domain-containing protein n=1 Tax=Sabulibacter ruber TaxID=2811901 RepID=UPI001A9762DD|nr:T9SS type A sorting domain-containing protein [Sabulibacter ruber]